eukprot:scaffold91636_cov36-Cyclotella_meneghiniana.AAC.3
MTINSGSAASSAAAPSTSAASAAAAPIQHSRSTLRPGLLLPNSTSQTQPQSNSPPRQSQAEPSSSVASQSQLALAALVSPPSQASRQQQSRTGDGSRAALSGETSAVTTEGNAQESSTAAVDEGGANDIDVGDELNEEGMSHKEQCEMEWAAVSISRTKDSKKKSWVYEYMHDIRVKKAFIGSDLVNTSKAIKKAVCPDAKCCTLCKDEGKSLEESVYIVKQGKPANANTHLKNKHAEYFAKKEQEEKEKAEQKKKRKTSSPSSNDPPKKLKQSPLSLVPKSNIRAGTKEERKLAGDQLEHKIVRFINNKALPDNVVECPFFRDLMDFTIQHAHLLGDYKHMGTYRFVSIQCKNWIEFKEKVSTLIKQTRNHYIKATGRRQAFVCVSHDVWEGKRKEINGLTIYFIEPVSATFYRIPIALTKPDGKKALELCATNMRGLERVGIEMLDLFKSANDGCTTAVKAGRLTVGGDRETMNRRASDVKDGCCDMHQGSLVMGHATTLTPRHSGGRVVNQFNAFHDLYKKTKNAVKHLCDRKNKSRFEKYETSIKQYDGSVVLAIPIPNKTRVSGAFILIQATIRSMHSLRIYSLEDAEFAAKLLVPEEWKRLSEFEAVMKPTSDFCFDVQGDRIELACEVPLMLAFLKNLYERAVSYDVMDTTKKWRANIPIRDIPRKKTALSDMLPESRELVQRFLDSIDDYFGPGKVNTDRCKSYFVYALARDKRN